MIPMRLACLTISCLAMSACASVTGAPRPVSSMKLNSERFKELDADFKKYDDENDIAKKKAIRNSTITKYMLAADDRYDEFTANISKEMHGSNLALDIGVLTLTGLGAVVNGAASELSAGAAVLTGSRSSLNKELYLERSIPAIVTAIDANRLRVSNRIAEHKKLGVADYSLDDALLELREYERAGSINRGINQLAQAAVTAFEKEQKDYVGAVDSCQPTAEITPIRRKINQYLYGIRNRFRSATPVAGSDDDKGLDRVVVAMKKYGLTPDTKATSATELESQIGKLTTIVADSCTTADAETMATEITGA